MQHVVDVADSHSDIAGQGSTMPPVVADERGCFFYWKLSILKALNCIFQGRLQYRPRILHTFDEFLPHVIMGRIELF